MRILVRTQVEDVDVAKRVVFKGADRVVSGGAGPALVAAKLSEGPIEIWGAFEEREVDAELLEGRPEVDNIDDEGD